MFNGSFRWNTVEVTFSEHRFWYIIWYSICGGNKTQEMQVLAHEHLHKGRTCLFLPIPCLAVAYVIFRGVNCHFFDWTDITNCLAIHRIAMKQTPILEICWKCFVNDLPIHIMLSLSLYISILIYIYVYDLLKPWCCPWVSCSKPPRVARKALGSPCCSALVQSARKFRWPGPGQDRPWRSDSIPQLKITIVP